MTNLTKSIEDGMRKILYRDDKIVRSQRVYDTPHVKLTRVTVATMEAFKPGDIWP